MTVLALFLSCPVAQRTGKKQVSTSEDSTSVPAELVNPPASHSRLKDECLEEKKVRKQLVKQERKVRMQWVPCAEKVCEHSHLLHLLCCCLHCHRCRSGGR